MDASQTVLRLAAKTRGTTGAPATGDTEYLAADHLGAGCIARKTELVVGLRLRRPFASARRVTRHDDTGTGASTVFFRGTGVEMSLDAADASVRATGAKSPKTCSKLVKMKRPTLYLKRGLR